MTSICGSCSLASIEAEKHGNIQWTLVWANAFKSIRSVFFVVFVDRWLFQFLFWIFYFGGVHKKQFVLCMACAKNRFDIFIHSTLAEHVQFTAKLSEFFRFLPFHSSSGRSALNEEPSFYPRLLCTYLNVVQQHLAWQIKKSNNRLSKCMSNQIIAACVPLGLFSACPLVSTTYAKNWFE